MPSPLSEFHSVTSCSLFIYFPFLHISITSRSMWAFEKGFWRSRPLCFEIYLNEVQFLSNCVMWLILPGRLATLTELPLSFEHGYKTCKLSQTKRSILSCSFIVALSRKHIHYHWHIWHLFLLVESFKRWSGVNMSPFLRCYGCRALRLYCWVQPQPRGTKRVRAASFRTIT